MYAALITSIFTLCVQRVGFGAFLLLLFPVRGLSASYFNKKRISKKAAIHITSLISVFCNSESELFLAVYHKHSVFTSEEEAKINFDIGYPVHC